MDLSSESPVAVTRPKMLLGGLHALRGIAAMMIVLFHLHWMAKLEMPDSFWIIKNYFGMAVPLFFVISAFSLYLSTFTRVSGPNWLRIYFIKRFFRIAPLFYLMICVYLVFLYVKHDKVFSLQEITINFLFLYNFFPGMHGSIVWAGWTIGVEYLIYSVLPFCLVYVRTERRALAVFLFCTVISIVARSLYSELSVPKEYGYMSFLGQIGVFAVGIPVYFIYRSSNGTSRQTFYGYLAFAVFLVLVLSMLMTSFPFLHGPGKIHLQVWAVAFGALILSQVLAPIGLITNRFSVFLGTLSFSLYLWHPLVIMGLKPVYTWIYGGIEEAYYAFPLCFLVTAVVLIAVAAVSHRLIEVPGIAAGERIIRHIKARTAVAMEPPAPTTTCQDA